MELLLDTDNNEQEFMFNWDIVVEDGIAETVPEQAELDQEAAVIAYLETNTIPLLEDKGTDWTGFLLKQKSLTEIDNKVRENLKQYLNTAIYTPVYTAENGALTVNLAKTIINSGAIQ